MRRYLYGHNSEFERYGQMGEPTDVTGINVGDLVRCFHHEMEHFLIVAKDETSNNFHPYGLWLYDLHKTNPKTVVPYHLITNEILAEHGLKYKEQEVKKMTLYEVEEELGFPIEIVK